MKVVFLNKVAGPEALGYGETPTPRPAARQVLVKVFATTIMPTEIARRHSIGGSGRRNA